MTHPHAEMLREIYGDLSRIGQYVADDVVLHRAGRRPGDLPARGKDAVVQHELALIQQTRNTLVMDLQHIAANDYFGAVLGVLRARVNARDLAMPFCGLWRFCDGRIVEHWENAYDSPALNDALTGRDC